MTKSPQFKPSERCSIDFSATIGPKTIAPKTIAIVCFDDAQLLDITGPMQVFSSANDLYASANDLYASANDLYEGDVKPYQLLTIAENDKIRTTSGLQLAVEPLSLAPDHFDTLIISGGRGINRFAANTKFLEWLDKMNRKTRRTASVCSGSLALAKLGLLDGKKAATHWSRIDEFRKDYPDVLWTNEAIFIRNGKIWTSAGITSGIDMALAMVEEDLGFDLAKSVARQLIVYLRRPGGQSQFSELLDFYCEDERFNLLNQWIMKNLSRPLSVAMLAEKCGMSERNFSRLYTRDTGSSPAKAIELFRLEAARQYLEQNWSIKKTARQCGFGCEETLRRVFQRHLHVSPQNYRDRFSRLPDE